MNKLSYLLYFMLFSASFILISQALSFDPETGDERLDQQLHEVNSNLVQDIPAFKSRVSTEYKVDEAKISKLLDEMEPAEVLMTLQLITLTSKSLEDILISYKKNHQHGWKTIAADLGIQDQELLYKEIRNVIIFNSATTYENSLSQR
ncbi:MAG: hypothetical protein EP338_03875 [Bacteroidetes bacterium]|nr:MAG: hypothetical protein EP338_03875 [Bacteroidota bacterium]